MIVNELKTNILKLSMAFIIASNSRSAVVYRVSVSFSLLLHILTSLYPYTRIPANPIDDASAKR